MDEQFISERHKIVDHLSAADRETGVSPLSRVRSRPGSGPTPVQIVQLTKATQEAQDILEEYYEAVKVVVRDKPGAIQRIIDDPASAVWLAYLEGKVAGCVLLCRLAYLTKASECKRLYVKPSARGHRIADKLLDAQEQYAITQGVEWIYLDT